MFNRNVYLFIFCMVFSVSLLFSGQSWYDGEIVRGPYINHALAEKVNVNDADFIQLKPQAAFATSTAAVGTVFKHSNGNLYHLSTGTTWVGLLATTTLPW